MNRFNALALGIFGTIAFSWLGLAYVPNLQIGHLDPQHDEEGGDTYPLPKSGMAERGQRVYIGNGCFYCHSQQVRPDYAAADIDRKWGTRRSAPRDYIFDRPVLLGKMRIGPDLSNVGHRAPAEDQNAPPNASPAPGASPETTGATNAAASAAQPGASPPTAPSSPAAAQSPPGGQSPAGGGSVSPQSAPAATGGPQSTPAAAAPPSSSPALQQPAAAVQGTATSMEGAPSESPSPYSAAWHHQHLYSPRSLNRDSAMPAYRFLYEKRRVDGQASVEALKLKGDEAPGEGWEIVPTYDAQCLVAYLMSLDQSHALKEVKSTTPPSPPAPGKSTK